MGTERKQFRACLDNEAACTAAGLRSWREVARATRGKPEIEVLQTVNGYFNRWPYKIDRELYGVSEFWATPQAFMKRSGACEDYAIATFFLLRARSEERRGGKEVVRECSFRWLHNN